MTAEVPVTPTPRTFSVCEDHLNADWNQPTLDEPSCVLCRLFYLEAQESLLEEWQQRAKRAEETIADIQRPLDTQMARLNENVVQLNGENERLERKCSKLRARLERTESGRKACEEQYQTKIQEVLTQMERAETAEASLKSAQETVARLRSALLDAGAALYNGFEPDNQSNAYKRVTAVLHETAARSENAEGR